MTVKVFLTALVASLFVWVAAAGASDVRHRPFHVRRASLVQDGQDLIWHVVVGHPFSPDRTQAHASLAVPSARAPQAA